MAGGLRELTCVLRENDRGAGQEEEEEVEEGDEGDEETHRSFENTRERDGRAPSPDGYEQPGGYYKDWTNAQKEEYKRHNPLILTFERRGKHNRQGSQTPAPPHQPQPSPAMSLPSRLSSIQLTPTPSATPKTPPAREPEPERTMPGALHSPQNTRARQEKRSREG